MKSEHSIITLWQLSKNRTKNTPNISFHLIIILTEQNNITVSQRVEKYFSVCRDPNGILVLLLPLHAADQSPVQALHLTACAPSPCCPSTAQAAHITSAAAHQLTPTPFWSELRSTWWRKGTRRWFWILMYCRFVNSWKCSGILVHFSGMSPFLSHFLSPLLLVYISKEPAIFPKESEHSYQYVVLTIAWSWRTEYCDCLTLWLMMFKEDTDFEDAILTFPHFKQTIWKTISLVLPSRCDISSSTCGLGSNWSRLHW